MKVVLEVLGRKSGRGWELYSNFILDSPRSSVFRIERQSYPVAEFAALLQGMSICDYAVVARG